MQTNEIKSFKRDFAILFIESYKRFPIIRLDSSISNFSKYEENFSIDNGNSCILVQKNKKLIVKILNKYLDNILLENIINFLSFPKEVSLGDTIKGGK